MPAGLYVRNADSIVQIDENFANLALRARSTVSVGMYEDGQSVLVSFTGESPIIFLRCTVAYVCIMEMFRTGNTFNWRLHATDGMGGRPLPVEYFIFDRTPPDDIGSGLAVYDSSGRVVFSSHYSYLRISASAQLPDEVPGYLPGLTLDTQVSGTYAACIGAHRMRSTTGSMVDALYTDGVRVTGTGCVVSEIDVRAIHPAAPHPYQRAGGQLLLADVSGL